jgi:hypothetical protein
MSEEHDAEQRPTKNEGKTPQKQKQGKHPAKTARGSFSAQAA